MTRVIVLGAGFAGLAAATDLAAAGADVVVVEARHRVGGRVWSATMDGNVIERGGEFILAGYDKLRELAARHGLAIADTGMSYYVREPRGVEGVDAGALAAAGSAVASGASGTGSVADVIAATDIAPALADAVRARIEISCALEADRLRPAVLQHVASFEPLPSHRIAAGNESLARAMAERLRIEFEAPARAIEQREDGVRVLLDAGELAGDFVVSALPLPVLLNLAIDPPLPDWKREALAAVVIGQAAKLHVALVGPAPPSAVMSVPDRFWCWTTTSTARVLNCFAGSPSSLRRLGLDTGPLQWLALVRNVRSDLWLASPEVVLTTWEDDPWALGAYRADGLAEVEEAELEAPVQRLHFAGEWCAGPLSGLMEGALRSGARAAAEVLAISSSPAAD